LTVLVTYITDSTPTLPHNSGKRTADNNLPTDIGMAFVLVQISIRAWKAPCQEILSGGTALSVNQMQRIGVPRLHRLIAKIVVFIDQAPNDIGREY
jgi:hypothetical protein